MPESREEREREQSPAPDPEEQDTERAEAVERDIATEEEAERVK